MNLTVTTQRRWIVLEFSDGTVLKHHIPRRNRYFKEELRQFREEIRTSMCGQRIDTIDLHYEPKMTFYHRVLYQAVQAATRRPDGLVLLNIHNKGTNTDASTN